MLCYDWNSIKYIGVNLMQSNYKKSRQGYREHLGVFVRSGWENNCLLWLTSLKYSWEYEPTTFYFEKIKRGTRSYTPDFKLTGKGRKKFGDDYIWVEVKGYLKPQDKTKTKRLKKYWPDEFARLQVITKNEKVAATKFYQEMGVPIFAYYDDIVAANKAKPLKNWE